MNTDSSLLNRIVIEQFEHKVALEYQIYQRGTHFCGTKGNDDFPGGLNSKESA